MIVKMLDIVLHHMVNKHQSMHVAPQSLYMRAYYISVTTKKYMMMQGDERGGLLIIDGSSRDQSASANT